MKFTFTYPLRKNINIISTMNFIVFKEVDSMSYDFDPDKFLKKNKDKDDPLEQLKRKNFKKIGRRLDGK